jgi:hypothetical protein
MIKLGKETRYYSSSKPQPRLLPEESILFSKQNVWLYESTCPPWPPTIGMPDPLLMMIALYITNQRTVVVEHLRVLNVEMSQWFPGTSAATARELIKSVAVRNRHFGTVKWDIFGFGGWRFGLGRTPFDKSGGNVSYLEVISGLPSASRLRTTKIFMGIGKGADEELELAHKVLLERLPH